VIDNPTWIDGVRRIAAQCSSASDFQAFMDMTRCEFDVYILMRFNAMKVDNG